MTRDYWDETYGPDADIERDYDEVELGIFPEDHPENLGPSWAQINHTLKQCLIVFGIMGLCWLSLVIYYAVFASH